VEIVFGIGCAAGIIYRAKQHANWLSALVIDWGMGTLVCCRLSTDNTIILKVGSAVKTIKRIMARSIELDGICVISLGTPRKLGS